MKGVYSNYGCGGKMTAKYEEGGEVESPEEEMMEEQSEQQDPSDYKEGDMVAKDGAVYKVMRGGRLAKQTASQVIGYLNDMGMLNVPSLVGGTEAAKKSAAERGIQEALDNGDMKMLSEYMSPYQEGMESPIKGVELRRSNEHGQGKVETPVGKGVHRFGN